MDRRSFLGHASAAALAPSLIGLVACSDTPTGPGDGDGDYGTLVDAGPELALPDGFTYRKFGVAGSRMADGIPTPVAHDGMAAFALSNGNIRLIRNHENRDNPGSAAVIGDPSRAYDPSGGGGTTSLEVGVENDGQRVLVRDFVSLNGTIVNCAGGPTPWGTWLSCEETTEGSRAGWSREHGYVFEVPAAAEGLIDAVPIRAMGRFVHEAVAMDPVTGFVYETEDRPQAGFYRFRPLVPGNLTAGGSLEMLKVRGHPNYDTSRGQALGTRLPVDWVEIPDVDPEDAEDCPGAVFDQGLEQGGALFARLEGCWFGDGGVYFHSTTGGDAELGQVWKFEPEDGGILALVFESPGTAVLGRPDNITVSPRGGIVICEDRSGTNYLRGLTRSGTIFPFARNIISNSEFAGACFSPDGETLFVNIQGVTRSGRSGMPGMTFAIWGPWERGAL